MLPPEPLRHRQAGAANGGRPTPKDLRDAGAVVLKPSRGIRGTVFVQAASASTTDQLPKIVLAGEHYSRQPPAAAKHIGEASSESAIEIP
jgi:hypothetical protein